MTEAQAGDASGLRTAAFMCYSVIRMPATGAPCWSLT